MTSRRVVGATLVALALALDMVACYTLAGAVGTRNDLFPRWLATRLWLTNGQDLYSAATDDAIRAALGPVPLGGETFVFGFVYPAYVALLLAPLALLPFRLAATLWVLLIQACVVSGTVLAWRADERERALAPSAPLPALVAGTLLPATVLNLLFMQFSALVLVGLSLAWWLTARGRTALAGVPSLLGLVKPQLVLLPVLAMVVRAAATGRWPFVASVTAGTAVVGVASLIAFPPRWIERFLASTDAYAGEARPASAAMLLGRLMGSEAGIGALVAIGVALLVGTAWSRSALRLGDWLGGAALLALWLVPPLYEWNNVVLLLVLVPALRRVRERGERACWLGCAALVTASAATLWAISLWPSESRLIWPTIGLGVYLAASRFGSQRLTSSGPVPLVETRS